MDLLELEEWLVKKIEFHQRKGNATRKIEIASKTERYVSAGHYQRVMAYKNVLANIRQPNKSLNAELPTTAVGEDEKPST